MCEVPASLREISRRQSAIGMVLSGELGESVKFDRISEEIYYEKEDSWLENGGSRSAIEL
jgi:hypothetical protein